MTPARSTMLLLAVLFVLQSTITHAQTVKFLAAGPSSLSHGLAIAAVNGRAGPNSHHWTGPARLAIEGSSEKPREGHLWVVWSSDENKVWAYLALDSAARVRSTGADARYKLQIDSAAASLPGQNKIASTRFKSGDACQEPRNGTICDAGKLPASIVKLLLAPQVSILYRRPMDQLPHCTNCCDIKCGPTEMELQDLRKFISDDMSIMRVEPGELAQPIGRELVKPSTVTP